ncbi:MAG: 16S rRNA methyltransferase [Desulfatitalea sp. BRH_c12]|nr:MAG: 16S rRNA methyltransferase [Desulfatitalea sp. BRH_c12]
MAYRHVSAMPNEVMTCLACKPGGIYVDCTLGGAGHASAICERIMPDGTLIGIDQDADAIANARNVLAPFADHIHLFHGNFIHLPDYLDQLHLPTVDGILLDLGLSQHQLETSGRGFTFQKDEPLDMRMDVRTRTRAEDLINQLPEDQLATTFWRYGEERWSKRIAKAVATARRNTPIRTTGQLVQLIRETVPRKSAAKQKIHPATRVFMALRIAVNEELSRLAEFLNVAVERLHPNGRICVLAFHSLEDRIVKQHFKQLSQRCTCPPGIPECRCEGRATLRRVTKKALRPSTEEADRNPMARSTRLRCAEKLAQEGDANGSR